MAATPGRREQLYPWAVVGGTLMLSMGGNALHATMAHGPAVSAGTAAGCALVFPALGALVLHTILRVWRRHPGGGARWLVAVPAALVFGMAFALSYQGLHALTLAIGIPHGFAWMGPLVIDVTTVAGVLDAMLLHHKPAADLAVPPPAEDGPDEESEPEDDHLRGPELEDADARRARVCAAIAATFAAEETPSARALAAEHGIRNESTVRWWIDRIRDGRWIVTADGVLVTDPPAAVTG